ncbi:MAG: molybdate ABC transporter substrate-binding protein [Zoogloeaceae bacterium]|jgi:molybdate transport system substrate-binding protein|nr:molybdate ABC transporter substrate-binding protein [Zoogloeaceae bacterium]
MPVRLREWLLLAAVFFSVTASAAEVTVSAAASLTDAFKDIARDYEARHAGVRVWLNFGASGALLQQIAKGAPVDVFASADQETMDQAQSRNLIAERRDFTRNALALVAPVDSRLSFRAVDDLRQAGVKRIAIGNPASVPAGRYAQGIIREAGLWAALEPRLIYTQNARQALDYVARGEVDAGFVFVTDAARMKNRVRVALDVPSATPVSYPIARVVAGPNGEEARRFIAHVLSPAGQAILARFGFSGL